MFAQESGMDLQKEREAFEKECRLLCYKGNMVISNLGSFYNNEQTNWMWQMWLSSKAQAVPEWISTSDRMPKEGEEVLVHSLGQVRQVTRDSKWAGGFKERNCYGWQAAYGQSHWMPKNIELPDEYHFYYKNDAKQKAMIEAQEQK